MAAVAGRQWRLWRIGCAATDFKCRRRRKRHSDKFESLDSSLLGSLVVLLSLAVRTSWPCRDERRGASPPAAFGVSVHAPCASECWDDTKVGAW